MRLWAVPIYGAALAVCGLGGGAAFNGNSSMPSLAWSYHWQDWPKFDYPYDFRGN